MWKKKTIKYCVFYLFCLFVCCSCSVFFLFAVGSGAYCGNFFLNTKKDLTKNFFLIIIFIAQQKKTSPYGRQLASHFSHPLRWCPFQRRRSSVRYDPVSSRSDGCLVSRFHTSFSQMHAGPLLLPLSFRNIF